LAATNGQSVTGLGGVTGSTVDRAGALPAAAGSLMRALPSVAAGGLLQLAQSFAASAGATGVAVSASASAGSAGSGGGASPAPSPAPGPGQGGLSAVPSGAGGVGFGGFVALIVLFALTVPALRRRVVLSPAGLGPAGFLSLLERPG
jgi:uncharacterized membrane protein